MRSKCILHRTPNFDFIKKDLVEQALVYLPGEYFRVGRKENIAEPVEVLLGHLDGVVGKGDLNKPGRGKER